MEIEGISHITFIVREVERMTIRTIRVSVRFLMKSDTDPDFPLMKSDTDPDFPDPDFPDPDFRGL